MYGWFRVNRSIVESPAFANSDLFKLWFWLSAKACFKKQFVDLKTGRGSTVEELQIGQAVVGSRTGSAELGWPESTFRDRLLRLEEWGLIKRRPESHYTIVTVVNYGESEDQSVAHPIPNRAGVDEEIINNQHIEGKNKKGHNDVKRVATHSENLSSEKGFSNFSNPSLDEITAYAEEIVVDKAFPSEIATAKIVSMFFDYYEARGWLMGRNTKVRDWKAAFRVWIERENETPEKLRI